MIGFCRYLLLFSHLASVVEGLGSDGHDEFDLIIIFFLAFIVLMFVFHCYLKKKESARVERHLQI